jgi:hypothetical protein
LWLRIKTVAKAVMLFGQAGSAKHEEARHKPEKAPELRAEAEELYDMRREIREQVNGEPYVHTEQVSGNTAPIQVTRIELSEKVERTVTFMLPLFVLFTLVVGVCCVVIGLDIAERQRMEFEFLKLDRQYRMTELKLDDWSVTARRAGLVLPGDYTRGPQGNMDSDSYNVRPNQPNVRTPNHDDSASKR